MELYCLRYSRCSRVDYQHSRQSMNEDDDQRRVRDPLVPRTIPRHSGPLGAARGHQVLAAGTHVAPGSSHHAGSTIRTGRCVRAALPRQVDVVVRLCHGRRANHQQNDRQGQHSLHLVEIF